MRNEQTKKATIHALDLMIRHADKGPSGFWVEDYEGCGNPAIFPEFDEGLQQERIKKAAHLIVKYPDEESLLARYYGEKDRVLDEGGIILFDPASQRNVAGAEKFSYNEYLDVQFASLGKKHRPYFANCFFNAVMSHFKGQIEKVRSKHICFERIFISGMYTDGTMFDGKEDHVWMDKSGFEGFGVGDSVSFGAEAYRYVKTGNGKLIDYGLRNPTNIQKIEAYELPTDDELIMQEVDQIICETCFLSEQCNRNYCTMEPKKKRLLKQDMFRIIKESNNEETQK